MIEELLRRLAEVHLDLSNSALALAEAHAELHDLLERFADDLYATEQDEVDLFQLREVIA